MNNWNRSTEILYLAKSSELATGTLKQLLILCGTSERVLELRQEADTRRVKHIRWIYLD